MASVADALKQFVPDYLAKYQSRMPPQHRKVLGLLIRCRTGELGNLIYHCSACQHRHWVGRSCSNRHCPNCQIEKTQDWLSKQTHKLLPVQHFVVTFTVPSELRSLLRGYPEIGYAAIFKAGSQTIRQLMANNKNLGSDKVGFFGVLHTWGRDLKDYHPHVHFVVPGGGVSRDGSQWLQVPRDQSFHPPAGKDALQKAVCRRNSASRFVSQDAGWGSEIRVGGQHQAGWPRPSGFEIPRSLCLPGRDHGQSDRFGRRSSNRILGQAVG